MSKKISEIYKEYKIIPILEKHMFRVTAVAELICNSLEVIVDKESILKACLLHDMGNIIKFDLSASDKLDPNANLEEMRKIQIEFIEKYGDDDHVGHQNIAREIGVDEKILNLMDAISFEKTCITLSENNLEKLICHYSDIRVAPFGVVDMLERIEEGGKRYNMLDHPGRPKVIECFKEVEKNIFSKSNITPEDITDLIVEPLVGKYKDFVI